MSDKEDLESMAIDLHMQAMTINGRVDLTETQEELISQICDLAKELVAESKS